MQQENVGPIDESAEHPTQKQVCQLDERGFFVGSVMADLSPLEPGLYLLPGGTVDVPPPEDVQPGHVYWLTDGGSWDSAPDFRKPALYVTRDGRSYTLNAVQDARAYDGIGPLPDWLTLIPRPNSWSIWNGSSWVEDAELLASTVTRQRSDTKARLLAAATQSMAPLQDAEDLGIATDDEVRRLNQWKRYRVELTRVDPAAFNIPWPIVPPLPV